MTTGASLTGSASVRKLQTVLHAKAKEEPDRRFHALVDKVWREDFLLEAWGLVRRNGGAAGVDGMTVADIEAYGVERWAGELSRDLRDGTYEPSPVRQVLIPKKQPGKFRPLGIPPERMTPHGFRAMARTILDEVLGFRPDFIEHQLAQRAIWLRLLPMRATCRGALVARPARCRGLGAPHRTQERASQLPADAAEAAGEGFGCDPSR